MPDLENEEMEPRIIKTQDENGEIHNFELIDIINIDDQDYGLLVYLEDEEKKSKESKKSEDEDEEEVVIMKLSREDDAFTFETIEDDDEFDKVVSYLETMEDDEEEEE